MGRRGRRFESCLPDHLRLLSRDAVSPLRAWPGWLTWLPLVWAEDWVIDLDLDYAWAVVGEPGHDYFWILAHEPSTDRAMLEGLKLRAT